MRKAWESIYGISQQEWSRTPRPPVILDEHEVPDLQHVGVILVDKMCSIPTSDPVIVDLTAGTARACVTHLPEVILHVAREDFGVIHPAHSGEDKPSYNHRQDLAQTCIRCKKRSL